MYTAHLGIVGMWALRQFAVQNEDNSLNILPRRVARGPGPLKVEAAQVAGDVDDFADEIKPRHFLGLKCFR